MARTHPFNFTHHLLPQLAWRRPDSVRRELSEPQLARELLQYLWDKAGETVSVAERVAPRGLRLHWHEVAGRAAALVLLPAPQATSEAYCVALVYEKELAAEDDDTPEQEEQLPRYFTLEATLGLDDGRGQPTLLCEWQGEHHRQHGRGPAGGRPDTPAHFLAALTQVLGPPPCLDVPPIMRIM